MGLFSKNPCVYCGKMVGFIKGKKLKDKQHICSDCEKNCSAFIEVSKFDKEFLDNHIEYMKKQNTLYETEFATLDKDDVFRVVRSFNGIAFADKIGMFEVITPKTEKKNYKELFRYDQIKDFRYYNVPNTAQDGKKYAEAGIEIDMKCQYDKNGFKLEDSSNHTNEHPYVAQFRIPFEKNTDNANAGNIVKNHLNELFGRASETLAGSIKEKFTGTGKERDSFAAQVNSLKALGGLAKAAVKKDEEGMDQAKENLKNETVNLLNTEFNYGAKYTEIANEAEKRAWKE